jgi:hypothetical protein
MPHRSQQLRFEHPNIFSVYLTTLPVSSLHTVDDRINNKTGAVTGTRTGIKAKYSEKICPSATVFATNPTWNLIFNEEYELLSLLLSTFFSSPVTQAFSIFTYYTVDNYRSFINSEFFKVIESTSQIFYKPITKASVKEVAACSLNSTTASLEIRQTLEKEALPLT